MNTIDNLEFGIPEEISKYTAHSAEIAIMILNFIHLKGEMNKKEFADLVGKTPSDITRWISGSHNFTIQTLSLIEAKTGMQIIRNLSDINRRKHLNGEVFNNPSENEIYLELMPKYQQVVDELQRLKIENLERINQKVHVSCVFSEYAEAIEYFERPNYDRFVTRFDQSVVDLNFKIGLQLRGKRKNDNVQVEVHEK